MSFRARLSLFFVLIVVVPMVALALLLVQVSDDSKTGKADARLATGVGTALTVYRDYGEDSRVAARRAARDPALDAALADRDAERVRAEAASAARRANAAFVRGVDPAGRELARSGDPAPIAIARVSIQNPEGRLGTVLAAAHTAADYARVVARLTGLPAVVLQAESQVAATVKTGSATFPDTGSSSEITLPGGNDYRARTVALDDAADTRLVLLGPPGAGAFGIRPAILVGLGAFFILAFIFTGALMRSLGGQHEEVSEQAATDALTGLANRRQFRDLLGKEAERARRFGRPVSLIMLDIDDFKRINDTYGHPQGDEVLRSLARVVMSASREIDEVARYGGEELAVILPETDPSGAREVAERIRERIEAIRIPRLDQRGALQVTASVGTASIPETADGAEGLVAAADEALYMAKRAGKNRTEQATARATAERST